MTKTILSLSLFICLMFTCCHKEDAHKPDCKITGFSSTDGSEYNVTYNSNGTISTSSSSTSAYSYTYNGNTITILATENGQFSSKEIATLNDDGMATNVRTEWNEDGTGWYNVAYEYNGTEVMKETVSTSAGGVPIVTIDTWDNGNMVSSKSGSDVTTYTYYTDKTSRQGDYMHLVTLTNGYEVYRTKNMIKSVNADSYTANIAYTFDSDDKATGITISEDGDNTTLSYQYQCN